MDSSATTSFAFDRIDSRTQRVTPALIDAVIERVVQTLRPAQVILFGSQALGMAEHDSDIDLFIRLDNHHPLANVNRWERSSHVLRLFPYRLFGLDVIVLTQKEVQTLLDANEGEWDLVIEILAKGKVVYERAKHIPVE